MRKSADRCIADILSAVSQRREIDYLNRAEIAQQNALTDKIHRNIQYIENHHPEALDRLLELTYDPNIAVAYAVGCNLMYLPSIPLEAKKDLLARLIKIVNDPGFPYRTDAVVFSFAVRHWEELLGFTLEDPPQEC